MQHTEDAETFVSIQRLVAVKIPIKPILDWSSGGGGGGGWMSLDEIVSKGARLEVKN